MNNEDWIWCMNYCKEHRNSPAQKWAWDQAKKALGSISDRAQNHF